MGGNVDAKDSGSLKTEKLLWTIADLAEEMQVCVSYARKLVKERKAPAVRIGYRTVRFHKHEIEKWLKKNFRS